MPGAKFSFQAKQKRKVPYQIILAYSVAFRQLI